MLHLYQNIFCLCQIRFLVGRESEEMNELRMESGENLTLNENLYVVQASLFNKDGNFSCSP